MCPPADTQMASGRPFVWHAGPITEYGNGATQAHPRRLWPLDATFTRSVVPVSRDPEPPPSFGSTLRSDRHQALIRPVDDRLAQRVGLAHHRARAEQGQQLTGQAPAVDVELRGEPRVFWPTFK